MPDAIESNGPIDGRGEYVGERRLGIHSETLAQVSVRLRFVFQILRLDSAGRTLLRPMRSPPQRGRNENDHERKDEPMRADDWGGQHPWDVPAFVVTHHVPDGCPRPGSTIQFVTNGIESAVGLGTTCLGYPASFGGSGGIPERWPRPLVPMSRGRRSR